MNISRQLIVLCASVSVASAAWAHHSFAMFDLEKMVTVEGTVKEDPRLKFRLRDDGQDPDLKAGDGIYTLRVDVQPQVPPGQFTLELTAYNSNGVPVLVKPKGGDAAPLTQIIPVSIASAPQQ